jgi:uncharacterized membrane protein YqhA
VKAISNAFEWLLWNSRFLTLIAVVASLFGSVALFYVATVDAVTVGLEVVEYGSGHLDATARSALRTEIVTGVAGFIDGYLFAVVLIIFAVGIYELFIDEVKLSRSYALADRVLNVKSLDDLKERLAKVILLVLIVRYFEYALHTAVTTALDVLYLSVGIALVAIALYLTKPKSE